MMKSFAAKLKEIEDDLDAMFQAVQEMLQLVSAELQRQTGVLDPGSLQRDLEQQDIRVNKLDVRLEERCLEFLALQHPVAIDLRRIIAALRMTADLERIGDNCVHIARRLGAMSSHQPLDLPALLPEMAKRASEMLAGTVAAYRAADQQEAARIRAEDDLMDQMQRTSISAIIDRMQQEKSNFDELLDLFSVTRHLERIADHTSNIAEEIIFFVEGKIVRHEPENSAKRGS